MPRATGPESPLGPVRPTPKPKFQVGDRVVWKDRNQYSARRYCEFCFLKHLIRRTLAIWNRVCLHLDKNPQPAKRLPDHQRNAIRKTMAVVREATTVEVIGIEPTGGYTYNQDTVIFNECYIGGVPGASSPIGFKYWLLIRWEQNGKRMAMFPGMAIAYESDLILSEPK
jgi:hypothetical protein